MPCANAPGAVMTAPTQVLLRSAAALLLLVPSLRAAQEQAPALPPLDIQWGQLQWGELSPDGRELGLAGEHASVVLLDLESGKVRLTIPHHRGIEVAAREVELDDGAWSPGGKLLATLFEDGRVELVSTTDGALKAVFATAPPDKGVCPWTRRMVRFASEDLLVVACGTTPAEVWSISEQRRLAQIEVPNGPATALALSRGGELIALGDLHGAVGVWRTRTGASTGRGLQVEDRVDSLAFSPDGSLLAVGADDDHDVRLLSLDETKEVRRFSHRDEDLFGSLCIGCVAFSPDGKRLLSTSFAFWGARMWDIASGKELWRYGDYGGGNEGGLWACFSADGQRVLLSLHGVVVDTASGKVLKTLVPSEELEPWFDSDGRKAWTIHAERLLVFSLEGDCAKLLDLPITPGAASDQR